ncbi:TonB-dependent receptor plug domain-containing protein [Lutibacter sp.]
MKNKLFHLSVLCVAFTFNALTAQENKEKVEQLNEVVVTATKFAVKKEKIGKIIYQITPEEIENSKGKTVVDLLNDIAGIEINGTNSAEGKNKSIYIRGGRNKQVLVLIDGVPVSDPSGITATYDLRLLTLSQIESIEVMNGAASTLYGSGAATGVINIILKKASKKPIALHYQASAGTNNSQNDNGIDLLDLNQNVAVNGTLAKFSYIATLNTSKVNGLSEASDANSNVAFESDEFKATNSFVRLGYQFNDKVTVQVFSNYDKNTYDYDAGAFTDSDINNGENKQFRVGLFTSYKYAKGNLKLTASYNKNDRMFESFNGWTNTTDRFEYTGKTYVVEAVNNYKFSNKVQLVAGVNYQEQRNQTNTPYGNIDDNLANYTTVDPYASLLFNASSGFNINAGVRLNNHSEYGNHVVYNINPSYNVTDKFRVISSYSTAFIAPSTYQLFSQFGNVDLNPEETTTIETGFEYVAQNKFGINSVFFYREEDNAIILPDFVTYVNASETINVKGVETEVKIDALKGVIFRLGHTYVYKSADLDYIPENKFSAVVEFNAIKNAYISLKYKNTSKRTYFDQWGTGENININAYSLVDLYGSYHIIKNKVSVFLQINNLFNEDYTETIGYTTRGRNFKLGLDFKF